VLGCVLFCLSRVGRQFWLGVVVCLVFWLGYYGGYFDVLLRLLVLICYKDYCFFIEMKSDSVRSGFEVYFFDYLWVVVRDESGYLVNVVIMFGRRWDVVLFRVK